VESSVGKGTAFTLKLPVVKVAPKRAPIAAPIVIPTVFDGSTQNV
jgi:hypothetical protein